MVYMWTWWIGRHAQTHIVIELDGIIEFPKTPIPFHALVTHMQIIPIHTTKPNIPEPFQIQIFNSSVLVAR